MNRRYYISSEARAILRAARVWELHRLPADTAQSFSDAQCTGLSNVEIAQQMEQLLDAYRDDYGRGVLPAPAAESVRHIPIRVSRARPVLVLPSQPHLRRTVMRCLVRRG
jgi:hypothetical protein